MIQEKSGFWDSIDPTPGNSGDERTYNASEITIPFEHLVTNGVQTGGAFLQVTPGSYDYSSQVAPGMAWIRGRWYLLQDDGTGGATKRILLHDAPIQYNRIDRIVLRYDANYTLSGRKIVAAVLKGEEAASPTAPALTRNDEIYELSLARVLIKPGQPTVLAADIADERFDSALCGIAEFAPQPNLQPYIDQFQQYLNDLFGDIEALDAAAITSGVLDAARLPLSNIVDSADEDKAATSKAVKTVNDKAAALEAANAPLTTGGSSTAYTLTPAAAIASYADGQIWTVRFHADSGANPTLNVSGKGAAAILESTGKAAKLKAGQIVRVMRYGSNFFTVSGGGLSLPSTITAGDQIIYAMTAVGAYTTGSTYTTMGAGWGITAIKAGTYRFTYKAGVWSNSGQVYARLLKNGTTEVAGSEITTQSNGNHIAKTIDVALNAGDVIQVQIKSGGTVVGISCFLVGVAGGDVQTELSTYVTAW